MNKRGQFYILAAVIIIGVILGLGVAVNTIKAGAKPARFYEMSDEFGKESYKVIDYSIANKEDVDSKIKEFAETYIPYLKESDPDAEVTFIFGDYDEVQVVNYTEYRGNINVFSNRSQKERTFGEGQRYYAPKYWIFKPVNREVNINISGNVYNFRLNEGQNFLFVLKKCKEEECYVSKS